MLGVWLYSSDGRAMYYVMVAVPMPPAVIFNNMYFVWSPTNGRYQLFAPPYAEEAPADHPEAPPGMTPPF